MSEKKITVFGVQLNADGIVSMNVVYSNNLVVYVVTHDNLIVIKDNSEVELLPLNSVVLMKDENDNVYSFFRKEKSDFLVWQESHSGKKKNAELISAFDSQEAKGVYMQKNKNAYSPSSVFVSNINHLN